MRVRLSISLHCSGRKLFPQSSINESTSFLQSALTRNYATAKPSLLQPVPTAAEALLFSHSIGNVNIWIQERRCAKLHWKTGVGLGWMFSLEQKLGVLCQSD